MHPDTAAVVGVPGLFCAGEAAGGLHGSNRLGGNSLSDLLVFGRRAGRHAAEYVGQAQESGVAPLIDEEEVTASMDWALKPFTLDGGENPYTIQHELQDVMNDLVGIIRTEHEMSLALKHIEDLKLRIGSLNTTGGRSYNPGWNLALDLPKQLLVSQCIALAALTREESRGGHTRDDFPSMDSEWRKVNLVCRLQDGDITIEKQPLVRMSGDLQRLFDDSELSKYMTSDELSSVG